MSEREGDKMTLVAAVSMPYVNVHGKLKKENFCKAERVDTESTE